MRRAQFLVSAGAGAMLYAYALPTPTDWLSHVGAATVIFIASAVLWLVLDCVREAVRTTRQVRRYLRAYHGNRHVRFHSPTLKAFVGCWVREFATSYNSLLVGGLELPHDPTKPVRRRW